MKVVRNFGLVLARTNLLNVESSLRLPGRLFRRMEPMAKAKRVRKQRAAAEAAKAGRRTPPPVGVQKRPPSTWAWIALAVLIAGAFAAVLILASTLGADDAPKPQVTAGGELTYADETAQMLQGVPQDGVAIGDPEAPVTLVEFADLQCPFCAQWATEAFPAYVDEYIRDGKVRVEFRPLTFIGEDSDRAARLAVAAGNQNKLWNVVELMYRNQGSENSGWVSDDFVAALGRSVPGLDIDQWLADADTDAVSTVIDDAQAQAEQEGVNSTPSFLIGKTGEQLEPVDVTSLGPDGLRGPIDQLLGQ
jgi:protein-disulfide isomerase